MFYQPLIMYFTVYIIVNLMSNSVLLNNYVNNSAIKDIMHQLTSHN